MLKTKQANGAHEVNGVMRLQTVLRDLECSIWIGARDLVGNGEFHHAFLRRVESPRLVRIRRRFTGIQEAQCRIRISFRDYLDNLVAQLSDRLKLLWIVVAACIERREILLERGRGVRKILRGAL